MYFVDSGRPLTGAPPLLKTRSHMRRNDARELWLRLKAQGWKQVAPQWGADVCCSDDVSTTGSSPSKPLESEHLMPTVPR